MFIHWAPYSVASVEASGSNMGPVAQWNITELEYVSLFKRFNPTQYHPKAWVELAKEAGQRYMVSPNPFLWLQNGRTNLAVDGAATTQR